MTISVVVPAFDAADFLEQAVRSVQAQTLQDWELVVVDDGSRDRTRDLAAQIAAREPRMRVLALAGPRGAAWARNHGIRASSGEMLCFLDADDYWYPEKLERQLAVMARHPDVDLVFCDADRVGAAAEPLGQTYLRRVDYLERAGAHLVVDTGHVHLGLPSFYRFSSVEVMGVQTSAVMLRRRALDDQEQWFPEDLMVGEDIDLWFRILQVGRAAFIDAPLYAYRQHEHSLMHQPERAARGAVAAHSRNLHRARSQLSPAEIRRCRRRLAWGSFDLGHALWRAGDGRRARRAFLESLRWAPGAAAVWAWGKTLLPPALVAWVRSGRRS